MNSYHEVAMLSAQIWGEANAKGEDADSFGLSVAQAYINAYDTLRVFDEDDADAIAYGMAVPGDATSELLRNIATKQAK